MCMEAWALELKLTRVYGGVEQRLTCVHGGLGPGTEANMCMEAWNRD